MKIPYETDSATLTPAPHMMYSNEIVAPDARRAYGLFISRFQGTWEPKPWQDYVIAKCTDGYDKDPLYETFKTTAWSEGKVFGATHYLRSALNWSDQIDTFLEHSQDADFLSIDFEGIGNTPSEAFAWNSQKATVKAREESKKKVAFYSSPKYVQEWMYPFGVYWVRDYEDLWVAQWPYSNWSERLLEVPLLNGGWFPRLPAGCKHWRFWQYGAEYLERGEYEGVGSKHVCLEVFYGTAADLRAWCGQSEPPQPPEPEPTGCNVFMAKIAKIVDEWKEQPE